MEVAWMPVGRGRLALSNRPKLKDVAELPSVGCQRIVTIQGHNELPGQIGRAAQSAGLAWTWVPVGHGKAPDGDADLHLRWGLVELVAAVEAGEAVLVHCSAGIHRTGMLAFALLRWLGMSEVEALEVLAQLRPPPATASGQSIWRGGIKWSPMWGVVRPNQRSQVTGGLSRRNVMPAARHLN